MLQFILLNIAHQRFSKLFVLSLKQGFEMSESVWVHTRIDFIRCMLLSWQLILVLYFYAGHLNQTFTHGMSACINLHAGTNCVPVCVPSTPNRRFLLVSFLLLSNSSAKQRRIRCVCKFFLGKQIKRATFKDKYCSIDVNALYL